MNNGTTEKSDVIQQLTPRTGARTRYRLSNLLDLTVSIRTSRLYSQIYQYFYRAAWNDGMLTRSSDENLSVCLSNVCIVTKRKKSQSRFYTMRKII